MTKLTPRQCTCGASYVDYRTGMTFADVRLLLRDQTPRSGYVGAEQGWFRQKRRNAVLGYWRELKLSMWYSDHGGCDAESIQGTTAYVSRASG